MIDAELGRRAASLLCTAAAELFEDEHLALVSGARTDLVAEADHLLSLGGDVAALGQALAVIVRRTASEDVA